MAENKLDNDYTDVIVTIFGRPITLTAEQLRTTATVLSCLTAHDDFQAREQESLWAAQDLLRGLRTPPARCDTCDDTGLVPWMHEADPNVYQEADADGKIPCPDCTSGNRSTPGGSDGGSA